MCVESAAGWIVTAISLGALFSLGIIIGHHFGYWYGRWVVLHEQHPELSQ